MRKLLVFLLIISFLSLNLPVYAYTQIPAYLCEIGIKFFNQGNYAVALHEFNKALMAQPGYPLALEYIEKINQRTQLQPQTEITPPEKITPQTRADAIKEFLDKIEKGTPAVPAAAPIPPAEVPLPEGIKGVLPPQVLVLDENIKSLIQPLEIEQGKNLIIAGRNITRFLVTSPEVVTVEKKIPNEILLTGKDFGHTYIHIWDEGGRWTLEFLTMPAKPEGLTLEEEMRLAEERASTFKLRYSLYWSSYEKGRRIRTLERQSYGYSHWISLNGQTPYGNLDANLSVRSLRQTTDLNYINLALTEGSLGPFKDFTLRGFDYTPPFSNLTFSSASLRGVMLESPAFNKKIDYTVFWGREGGGRYGNLSPGLGKIKDSFLSGIDVDYSPFAKQNYGLTLIHGWGSDRPNDLNPYNYDMYADWNLDKLSFRYEIAHDSETFAHLFTTNFKLPKLKLTAEIRNTDKDFKTATTWGWRLGELGALLTLSSVPTEKLHIFSRLDVFQDRLYPSLENDNRWNEDLNWNASYAIDSLTSLRLDYTLQNELGRLGEFRYQSPAIGLNRTLEWFRKIYAFANFRHQEHKNFSSPSLDYLNEKASFGLRFPLIAELYYYFNKEYNWLDERYYSNHSRPEAMETGVDWSGQFFDSPFYGNARCMYRDEENAASSLSFLSGEDYLEGYAELSYRPNPDKELYCSARIRNVWAENPDVNKRLEADFNAGMRYTWDTGVRWESVGTIDGYVFNDLNADGLRQRDEPPIDGIKVWLGKDKSQLTDILGYYKFTKVKAKKAYVSIDTDTIPSGYILTCPQTQDAMIASGQAVRINFGLASRSEIMGMVFEDVDGDGQLGIKDLPVKGAVLILEDDTRTTTDETGKYFFRKVSVGKHTITLDLNSLPTIYLPKVPIFKEVDLSEGVSYNYNIPLKKAK